MTHSLKNIFASILIFLLPGLILSQNEVWLVKQLELEEIDGDTIEYWDEVSVSVLKEYDSIPYLTDFYSDVEEIKKYGGFLKLQEDITIENLLKKYDVGKKQELAGFLSNELSATLIKSIGAKEYIIALGETLPASRWKREERLTNIVLANNSSHQNTPLKWAVPKEKGTLIVTKTPLGEMMLTETFIIEENSFRYDGFHFPDKIISKGTWVFITSNEDPYFK